MDNKPYVLNVLFCDDVRTEASGKEIAIGIYPGYIALANMPFLIPLLMIRLELMFYGQPIQEFSLKVVDPNGNVLTEQSRPFEFAHWNMPGSATFVLQGLIVSTPGEYGIFTRVTGRDWEFQRNLHFEKVDPLETLGRWEAHIKKSKEMASRLSE